MDSNQGSRNQGPRNYSVGDTVTIAFELTDESGVGQVAASFMPEGGQGEGILLRGNGEGAKRATVQCRGEVQEVHSPGKYSLHYLQASDIVGNTRMLNPQPWPEFYVNPHLGDSEGPRYQAWAFLD